MQGKHFCIMCSLENICITMYACSYDFMHVIYTCTEIDIYTLFGTDLGYYDMDTHLHAHVLVGKQVRIVRGACLWLSYMHLYTENGGKAAKGARKWRKGAAKERKTRKRTRRAQQKGWCLCTGFPNTYWYLASFCVLHTTLFIYIQVQISKQDRQLQSYMSSWLYMVCIHLCVDACLHVYMCTCVYVYIHVSKLGPDVGWWICTDADVVVHVFLSLVTMFVGLFKWIYFYICMRCTCLKIWYFLWCVQA